MNSETRQCQNCKSLFTIEPDDFALYDKLKVPPPTWCPLCRFQRRLCFMNERTLYKRDCDLCGTSVISMFPQEQNLTVYCNPCWWSDAWDPLSYGRDYDPSRSFLEQVRELHRATPHVSLYVNYPTLVNSDYINHAATAKNCYLIYSADECENVLYSEILLHDKDSLDCTLLVNSELCYGSVNTGRCSRVFFSEECPDSINVYFCRDCRGCSNCFGCVNLRKKSYYIFNQPYTKEDYHKKLVEFRTGSYASTRKLRKQVHEFWLTGINRFRQSGTKSVNVSGEYVFWSKNAHQMYLTLGAEDSKYCQILTMTGTKDAWDYTIWGNNAQRIYECMIVGEGADTVRFSVNAWPNVREVEYSLYTISSSNMLGCSNIRNKQYCILNKQYAKEEFEKLRATIIKDMTERPYRDAQGRAYPYGELFPPEFSSFPYNISYANDFFPLVKEEALRQGYEWRDPAPNPHAPTIQASEVPDEISDVTDSILKEIIECGQCKNPFRIVQAELVLLRRFGLPAPRACPNCRYRERFKRLNPPRFYHRACQCNNVTNDKQLTTTTGESTSSGNGHASSVVGRTLRYANTVPHFHGDAPCPSEFETAYAPDRPEIVYCEQCYRSEVV